MRRYTKKIKNANNYCEYDLKYSPYMEIFDLTNNMQIEDYVNADLTLAIDKLGKLEDLEEELGCPLEVVFKAISNGIYVKNMPREDLIKQFGLKLSNIETEWYLSNNIMCVNLKDYKTSFWLKEDKSE